MELVAFAANDIENTLAKLKPAEIDGLAFGVVQVDAQGKIVAYNRMEGVITGRDPGSVIGKNFFSEVAPCTNVRGFRDKFDAGVKAGNLNALVEWEFNYNMQPTRVSVHMKKAAAGDTYWIFVKRL